MQAVSVAVIRELERRAVAAGIGEAELMERAGRGAAAAIADYAARRPVKRLVIVCGKGNNGGDGRVVARYWRERPGVVIEAWKQPPAGTEFRDGDLIVDAMLGIGSRGALRSPLAEWVGAINASGLPVVALDIPTGLDADTGEISGPAVRADLTVTFGLPKLGLFLHAGPGLAGVLRCIDIGLDGDHVESRLQVFMGRDARRAIAPRSPDCHKNSCGRVLVVAGSAAYPGAGVLAARGAMRGGAGLVTLATAEVGNCVLPAALIRVAPGSVPGLIEKFDSVVAGCGWGDDDAANAPLLGALCARAPKLVLDADALNLIARKPELYRPNPNAILTPHPGEAERLAKAFGIAGRRDRAELAAALAGRTGAVVVLKGHRTVTAAPDGRRIVNGSGSPALATAGSGDVLAGLIGALYADGRDAFTAAALGVYLHGRAGEKGNRAMIADDLADLLVPVFDEITPFA